MKIEERIVADFKKKKLTLSVAESCSGGLITHRITNVPGSSLCFERGFVVYSNRAKIEELKVEKRLIEKYGAVSKEVAESMAKGVRNKAGTDLGLAVTGIAGPGGATSQKPVGLVYIALSFKQEVRSAEFKFKGEREIIKQKTSDQALSFLHDYLGL